MLRPVIVCALAVSSLSAAVTLTQTDVRIHIEIGGKPFSDFYYGRDAPKPYLHPLRSASGKIVTRRFPMQNVPGESTTDKHHRGVWLGFKSVNGFNFWENEFSYNDKNAGKVVTRAIEQVRSGESAGSFSGIFAWLSPAGEAMLERPQNDVSRRRAPHRRSRREGSSCKLARARVDVSFPVRSPTSTLAFAPALAR